MTDTMTKGESYYKALGEKDIHAVEQYLHQDIVFSDPQEKAVGKETVLKAAKRFMGMFKSLTICTKFGSSDQAMIIYEVEISGLSKPLKAASLLSFKDGLISEIELIYNMKILS